MKRTLSQSVPQSRAARATILAKRRKLTAAADTVPVGWSRVGMAGLDLTTACRTSDAVAASGCEIQQKARQRSPLL